MPPLFSLPLVLAHESAFVSRTEPQVSTQQEVPASEAVKQEERAFVRPISLQFQSC